MEVPGKSRHNSLLSEFINRVLHVLCYKVIMNVSLFSRIH